MNREILTHFYMNAQNQLMKTNKIKLKIQKIAKDFFKKIDEIYEQITEDNFFFWLLKTPIRRLYVSDQLK